MSPAEFTIETAAPPPIAGRGGPKSALRQQLELLQPGQVLRWRPAVELSRSTANYTAAAVAKLTGAAFTVRKADGGHDIYRTE